MPRSSRLLAVVLAGAALVVTVVVVVAVRGSGRLDCPDVGEGSGDQVVTETRAPVPVDGTGSSVTLGLEGYEPGSSVEVSHYGQQVATLTAGQDGTVAGPLTLPSAPPGVQEFEVRGHTAVGTALGHDLRLTYPGAPRPGQDYTFYVDGFESHLPGEPDRYDSETVSVTLATIPLGDFDVEPEGGVLITVPLPVAWPAGGVEVVVTGQRSGIERTVHLGPDRSAHCT